MPGRNERGSHHERLPRLRNPDQPVHRLRQDAERRIEFISDTTPAKQGKLSPGAQIPVKPHEAFAAAPPDYAVLFAWNHFDEINQKERKYRENGGKWIIPVRMVEVL